MEQFKIRAEGINPRTHSIVQASVSCRPISKSDAGSFDQVANFGISFRRIGAGLANLGNTCFLNSVLQCLTYTEPFAAYLQSGNHKSSCRTSGFCALCALQNHVMDALRSTGKILRPFHLVKNLRCISRNFRNARQEDAHEYMVNLLESMHKCCLPFGVASESPLAYEKSLVHKIFGGHLRSQVKCLQCSFCSDKFDPFLDLSLEINKADSLHKALSHFTAVEQLDGGARQYHCQKCKQKVRAVKQLTVHKAPYVLTVHLKRFGTASLGQKIDKRVDFDSSLDLKRYVSGPFEGDLKYTLYGVLVHAGYATHSGHYYCFVRTSGGQWYSLNDHQVLQVPEKTVLNQKAYMLFYVRNMNLGGQNIGKNLTKENSKAYNSVSKISSASLDVAKPSQICGGQSGIKDNRLLKTTETESQANLPSTNKPSPSVSPLSSLTSEDLAAEGPSKPSSRGSFIYSVEEDLMQTAQSKDKSPHVKTTESEDVMLPIKPAPAEIVLEEESSKSGKRKLHGFPDFKSMMFGSGRFITYLSLSGKKRRKIRSSTNCRRSKDLSEDQGPSTSAGEEMTPPRKARRGDASTTKSELKAAKETSESSTKGSSDMSIGR
ncbi:ubiquitin carboxyl-terminal hydrolase 23-like [Wolffia australiana]